MVQVTKPDFVLKYDKKDITGDVASALLSFSYTDYLGEQSDELQLEFENGDGRWLRAWFPEFGDVLNLSCGDQFHGLVSWGDFEIAEIEWQRGRGGDTVAVKALATGISKGRRTNQSKAFVDTTLKKLVHALAQKNGLKVVGKIADIEIKRVTQYQERDVEFLTRIAAQYGYAFKIKGDTLVFAAKTELAKQEPVKVIEPEEIVDIRLRDMIKGASREVEVRSFDTKQKKTVESKRKGKGKGKQGKTSGDALKLVSTKRVNQAEADKQAEAAQDDEDRCAGTVSVAGNPLLVAGQVVELKRVGKFSGQYLVKQARHDFGRGGYTTELEIKMVRYIEEGEQKGE